MKSQYVWFAIILIVIEILAFDAYLYLDNIPGNSITQVMVALISTSPLFAGFVGFCFGFLFCHFFDVKKQGGL